MFNSNRIIKNNRLNKLYKQTLVGPSNGGEVWEVKFSAEILWDGRQVKFMAISDLYNNEILSIEATEVELSIESQLLKMLERLKRMKQLPATLVYDHSSFISIGLDTWCRKQDMKQFYLFSGHPSPNLYLARSLRKKNVNVALSCNRKQLNF